jgi:hypothetical protein
VRLAGKIRLQAPRSRVWSAVADPEALGRGLPGARDVGLDSDGTVHAHARRNGSVTVRGVLGSIGQRVLPSIAADQIESVLRAAAATPTASRWNPPL